MKALSGFLYLLIFCLGSVVQLQSQDLTFFFAAGDLSGEPDRFGNTHEVVPSNAIDPRPFGNEQLADVFFDEDNLWLIYQYDGNLFLVSHGPGYFEDAPELAMNITPAIGGKYEVIFNFMDDNSTAGLGPIQAALGDDPLQYFDGNNATRATGGTTPPYPQPGNISQGSMFWYSVSLGEVEVAGGEVIKVRVDDVQGDTMEVPPPLHVTSSFRGVTLRVIELGGAISEIQVSPGAHEWTTDVSGNEFRTWPMDEAAYPTISDWLTTPPEARVDGNGKWHMRGGLGPYGPILESFPNNGNDAMPLRTSIRFAEAGTYEVYFSIGDTAAANFDQNIAEPNPLKLAREGEELKTWHPNDGEFKSTPGYNDYEIYLGDITVEAGEQLNYIVDDDPEYENVARSVYLGMRFVKKTQVVLNEIQVSPGVHDNFTDIGGNMYRTWPVDEAAYPTLDDWLTTPPAAREDGNGKWHMRGGLGPYGPILESFPVNGNDAMPLRTSITFARAGTYDVYMNIGDTGVASFEDNETTPNPLQLNREGEDAKVWVPNDGVFISTPGYNDYEISLGQITVNAGETVSYIVDDVQGYPSGSRSVYLGMRFVFSGTTDLKDWLLY